MSLYETVAERRRHRQEAQRQQAHETISAAERERQQQDQRRTDADNKLLWAINAKRNDENRAIGQCNARATFVAETEEALEVLHRRLDGDPLLIAKRLQDAEAAVDNSDITGGNFAIHAQNLSVWLCIMARLKHRTAATKAAITVQENRLADAKGSLAAATETLKAIQDDLEDLEAQADKRGL